MEVSKLKENQSIAIISVSDENPYYDKFKISELDLPLGLNALYYKFFKSDVKLYCIWNSNILKYYKSWPLRVNVQIEIV